MKKLIIVAFLWCSALMAVSPTQVMLYSAFIPGAGQIYNKSYTKAGIVIGIQGWNIGRAFYNGSRADDFAKKAQDSISPFDQQFYESRSREYREKRNSDIWWIGITAALSTLDAYVDAHLNNFESEKEGLHLRFEDGKAGISIRF